MSTPRFIPFHKASIGEDEIREVTETLRSGWITTGDRTARFEKEFRDYVQAPHALGVNSCTAGLHLALHALELGPGDEVITTPLTFCATINTILQVGATPILADIDEFGNIDPDSVEERIGPNTRAILPVHFAGAPCRMDEIWALARRHGLFVVEDAAHAVGSLYRGRPIGAAGKDGHVSDAVAFSFYATKSLSTGEGGMVTTHNADMLERLRILCLHGISRDAWSRYTEKGNWFYEVVDCGFKYNLSDIQSAIGIHQLRKQEAFVAKRAQIARQYNEIFAGIDELETPYEADYDRHAWHLYVLRLRPRALRIDRAGVLEKLRAAGIGTSVHFIPIPMHPYYSKFSWANPLFVPRAMSLYERIFSLPIYPDLTGKDVDRIADAVTAVLNEHRQRLVAV